MALNYETTNWENGKTVLKAEHLRKIEKGITDIIAENDAIYTGEDIRRSNEEKRQEEHLRKMNEASEVVSNIQEDYDSLQRVIIDENISIQLQEQINSVDAQLNQKLQEQINSVDAQLNQKLQEQINSVNTQLNQKTNYCSDISSLKNSNLEDGESVFVGENSSIYSISNTSLGIVDEISCIQMENGNYACIKIDDGLVNVKKFGAKGDGVTDDTLAFRKAMDYIEANVFNDVWGGWDTHKYSLFVPSGVYIISEADTLTIKNNNIFSAGFTVKGNGMTNSIIKYTSTDTERYLCQVGVNNNVGTVGAFLNFKDISIRGNNNNNFFAMYSQNGAPQDVYFTNCDFRGLKHNIVVRYGSANANADKFKFFGCNFSIPSGGILFGILDKGISQSVAHNFYGCNVYSEGTCIYLRSAGNLTYDGGSCVIKNGRFLDIEGLGADIPMNVGKLVVQNVKFEFFDNSVDDTLIYNNSSLPVVFSKCGFGQMVATKPTNRMINLQGSADVCFEHCVIPEPIKTLITNPGNSALKAFLKFDNCILSPLQSYNIENTLTSASYNVHYLGKVVAENCHFGKDNPKENRLVNFHSDILRGFNIIPPILKSHFIRNTGWGNVEYFGGTNTLYLPKSSTLKNIKFYLVNKTGSTTLTVKKGTKTIFTIVVDLSTIKDTNRLVETGDLLIEFSSDNIEENKLTIESSLGEIKGFVEVQYY